jgi:hypothetical protein
VAEENPGKYRAQHQRHRDKHRATIREKSAVYMREWRAKNREEYNRKARERRQAKAAGIKVILLSNLHIQEQ